MVNDITYLLFKKVELKTYPMIEESFHYMRNIPIKDITMTAVENPDIQFIQNIVAVDVQDEFAQELLMKLLEDWVIIHGNL